MQVVSVENTLASLKNVLEENESWKLLSKDKLHKTLAKNDFTFSKAVIEELHTSKELHQVYKQRSGNVQYFRITALPDSYQADVVLVPQYRSTRDKFLLLIEILSRKVYTFVLPSGQMSDMLEHFRAFMQQVHGRPPRSITADNFFECSDFRSFCEKAHIGLTTHVAKADHAMRYGSHLGILDRAVRTLKMLLQKAMVDTNSTDWTEQLTRIVQLYNTTPHTALQGKTPHEAYMDKQYLMDSFMRDKKHNIELKQKLNKAFAVGDRVRLALPKSRFTKEGESYSRSIYRILGCKGNGFVVQDDHGINEPRAYLARELQLVTSRHLEKIKDVALQRQKKAERLNGGSVVAQPAPQIIGKNIEYFSIERIVKHRRVKGAMSFLVKWEGYVDSENSWLSEEQLKKDMTPQSYKLLVDAYWGTQGAGSGA